MNNGQTGHPPTGPQTIDMQLKLWHWLVQQGLGVAVLIGVCWYFSNRISDLEGQLKLCQSHQIELITQTVQINTRAIDQNTHTLQLLVSKIDSK